MKICNVRLSTVCLYLSRSAMMAPVALGLCALQPASGAELVTNGGFELNPISYGSYVISPSSAPGWTLDTTAPYASVGSGIEIQNHVAGSPYQGNQFCELNSDATTAIYQDLATVAGQTYNVSFAYSPRPGVAINTLHFTWGGTLEDTITGSGVGNPDTVWSVHDYTLTASANTTRIEFDDLGDPNSSLGTYIDAVSVTAAVPEPGAYATIASLGLTGAAFLRRKRAR